MSPCCTDASAFRTEERSKALKSARTVANCSNTISSQYPARHHLSKDRWGETEIEPERIKKDIGEKRDTLARAFRTEERFKGLKSAQTRDNCFEHHRIGVSCSTTPFQGSMGRDRNRARDTKKISDNRNTVARALRAEERSDTGQLLGHRNPEAPKSARTLVNCFEHRPIVNYFERHHNI